jgi:hypothetical protein
MKKKISTMSLFLMVAGATLAQNETDVLRYSQLTFGGTARSSAMAGSMGSLGADFSTLSMNPAGIGVYRRSEITFTPSLYFQTTNSSYNGTSSDDQRANFNVGNIGIVFTKNLDRPSNASGWKFFQIGFGMNRLANFQTNTTVTGVSSASLLDQFRDNAQGLNYSNLDPFSTQLAYYSWLIDPDSLNNYTNKLGATEKVTQTKSTQTRGAYNETVISFGGNFMDKLFLGATIGLPTIRYTESSVYTETSTTPGMSNFRSLTYNQDLSTNGNGVNFKIGAIYKPIESVRLGFALHTPTWLTMSDSWSASMSSSHINYQHDTTAVSPQGNYDYSITTPMRVIGSAGYVIGKFGALNVDYEYVNYATARLSNSGANVFTDQNTAIRKDLTAASNIRVGGEIKLKPCAIRLGWAYYGDPYSSSVNSNGSHMSYTGGIGFRGKHYFADLAYVLSKSNSNTWIMDPNYVNPTSNSTTTSSYMLTVGVKF